MAPSVVKLWSLKFVYEFDFEGFELNILYFPCIDSIGLDQHPIVGVGFGIYDI
jgi:hypothetical protein